MTFSALLVNIFVGLIFVLLWGVLSYVASNDAEFKSFFFGGLANFVFFIGGILASYLSSLSRFNDSFAAQTVTSSAQKGGFNVMTALNVAAATMSAIVLANLTSEGFTNSISRLHKIGSISFHPEGYRDIQIYASGSFGVLCFIAAWLYGLYLGSVKPKTTYPTVLVGVAISLGAQGFLYLIFGIFFDSQVSQILNVSTPPVFDTYAPLLKWLFGIGMTFATAIFGVLIWTTLFWLAIKLGNLGRVIFS